jgi:hypothetical protein
MDLSVLSATVLAPSPRGRGNGRDQTADAEGDRGSNEPRVNRVARLRVQYIMCHGKDASAIFPVCRLYPFPTRKWPGATYPFGHVSSLSMRNLHAAVLAE